MKHLLHFPLLLAAANLFAATGFTVVSPEAATNIARYILQTEGSTGGGGNATNAPLPVAGVGIGIETNGVLRLISNKPEQALVLLDDDFGTDIDDEWGLYMALNMQEQGYLKLVGITATANIWPTPTRTNGQTWPLNIGGSMQRMLTDFGAGDIPVGFNRSLDAYGANTNDLFAGSWEHGIDSYPFAVSGYVGTTWIATNMPAATVIWSNVLQGFPSKTVNIIMAGHFRNINEMYAGSGASVLSRAKRIIVIAGNFPKSSDYAAGANSNFDFEKDQTEYFRDNVLPNVDTEWVFTGVELGNSVPRGANSNVVQTLSPNAAINRMASWVGTYSSWDNALGVAYTPHALLYAVSGTNWNATNFYRTVPGTISLTYTSNPSVYTMTGFRFLSTWTTNPAANQVYVQLAQPVTTYWNTWSNLFRSRSVFEPGAYSLDGVTHLGTRGGRVNVNSMLYGTMDVQGSFAGQFYPGTNKYHMNYANGSDNWVLGTSAGDLSIGSRTAGSDRWLHLGGNPTTNAGIQIGPGTIVMKQQVNFPVEGKATGNFINWSGSYLYAYNSWFASAFASGFLTTNASGNSASLTATALRLSDNAAGKTNVGIFGYAVANDNWLSGSKAGDLIIQNTNNAGRITLGTGPNISHYVSNGVFYGTLAGGGGTIGAGTNVIVWGNTQIKADVNSSSSTIMDVTDGGRSWFSVNGNTGTAVSNNLTVTTQGAGVTVITPGAGTSTVISSGDIQVNGVGSAQISLNGLGQVTVSDWVTVGNVISAPEANQLVWASWVLENMTNRVGDFGNGVVGNGLVRAAGYVIGDLKQGVPTGGWWTVMSNSVVDMGMAYDSTNKNFTTLNGIVARAFVGDGSALTNINYGWPATEDSDNWYSPKGQHLLFIREPDASTGRALYVGPSSDLDAIALMADYTSATNTNPRITLLISTNTWRWHKWHLEDGRSNQLFKYDYDGNIAVGKPSNTNTVTLFGKVATTNGFYGNGAGVSNVAAATIPQHPDVNSITFMDNAEIGQIAREGATMTFLDYSLGDYVAIQTATNWQFMLPLVGNAAGLTNLPLAGISASGTPSSGTYLRGDWTWATPGIGGASDGITNLQAGVTLRDTLTITNRNAGGGVYPPGLIMRKGNTEVKLGFGMFGSTDALELQSEENNSLVRFDQGLKVYDADTNLMFHASSLANAVIANVPYYGDGLGLTNLDLTAATNHVTLMHNKPLTNASLTSTTWVSGTLIFTNGYGRVEMIPVTTNNPSGVVWSNASAALHVVTYPHTNGILIGDLAGYGEPRASDVIPMAVTRSAWSLYLSRNQKLRPGADDWGEAYETNAYWGGISNFELGSEGVLMGARPPGRTNNNYLLFSARSRDRRLKSGDVGVVATMDGSWNQFHAPIYMRAANTNILHLFSGTTTQPLLWFQSDFVPQSTGNGSVIIEHNNSTFRTGARIVGRKSGGTPETPTTSTAGDIPLWLCSEGYTTTGLWTNTASILFAVTDPASAKMGQEIRFRTGTTTGTDRVVIREAGSLDALTNLNVGGTANLTNDLVVGGTIIGTGTSNYFSGAVKMAGTMTATNFVGMTRPPVKASFYTNYTVLATSDAVLFASGTNQLISLPDAAATAAGYMLTVVSVGTGGSVVLTNYNGTQKINNSLSITNGGAGTATNRLTIICDGANWW